MPLSRDPRKRARQLANLRPAPPVAPPGNDRAAKHHVHATILLEPDSPAMAMLDWLCRATPFRGPDGLLPAQHQLTAEITAIGLTRLKRAKLHLDDNGEFTRAGKLRPVADYERRLIGTVLKGLDALGLTPRSEAGIVAQAVDVANAISHPDPAVRHRQIVELGLEDGDGD